ncbi:MAG: radical SAM protein [Candidatus Aenigmatarchaeota archaeon]
MKLALVPMYRSSGADPPIGLGSIATYLKEYGNFDNTVIIDAKYENIIDELRKEKPNIIGLSAMTMYYGKACELAKNIKKEFKDVVILIGGVHISTLPESFDPVFDIGVIGEGEETMFDLMKAFRSNKTKKSDLKKINGLVFSDKNKLVITKPREMIMSLDRIPIIDRSFFSKRFKNKCILETRKAVRMANIMTSRGCPYHCRFCSTSLFWKKYRMHSVRRVADEIEYLYRNYKVEFISIWDDLFLVNKERLKELANDLKKRGILGKIKFNAMARANLVDDELCRIANELGVIFFNFGFESGSDRMIKYLKRESVTLDNNKKSVILCKKYGIRVGAALIIGSPTETIDDMRKTVEFINFLRKQDAEIAWLSIMSPLPGTEMWDIALKRGRVSNHMDWRTLSEYHLGKPILLDDDVDYEEFKMVFSEARSKIRYFEMKLWLRRFFNNPLMVTKIALSGLRFLKFFTLERAE